MNTHTSKRTHTRTARRVTTATLLAAALSSPTYGLVWTGNHPGLSPNWDATSPSPMGPRHTNWAGSPLGLPGGISLLVEFGNGQTGGGFASGNPTLNGDRTIGSIDINHSGNQFLIANTLDTLTIATGNISRDSMSMGTHIIGSRITLGSSGEWNIAGAGGLSITNTITGTDTLTKTGTGTLSLGAANPFSGTADINAGTVLLAHADALQNATVNLNDDNVLDITTNTLDANLGALGGPGALDIGTQTLTVGSNDDSTSYDGILSGTGLLIKTGTGDLTLTQNNTHGGTRVNDGVLEIDNDNQFGSTETNLTLDTGEVRFTGHINTSSTRNLVIEAGNGTVNTNGFNVEWKGNIEGPGVLIKTGEKDLELTNSSDHAGITIEGGSVTIERDVYIGGSGAVLTLDGGELRFLDVLSSIFTKDTVIEAGGGTINIHSESDNSNWHSQISGPGTLTKIGSGVLALLMSDNTHAATVVEDGILEIDNDNRLGTSGADLTLDGGELRIADNIDTENTRELILGTNNGTFNTNGFDATWNGLVSGANTLTKTGSGTLTLTAANTFSGGLIIDGGTVSLANDSAAGTGAITVLGSTIDYVDGVNISNTIDLQNDVTLNVDTGAATQSGAITETGGPFGITKTGPGNLTLSAANTFTGPADIDDGTLVLAHADALLNNTVSINTDNGLDVTTNTLNANLGGLAGNGALDIGAQTLTVGSNDASTTFTDGGGGGLQGTGTLVKAGTGTLELAGSHSSFNGAITVAGGALTMNAVDMQVAAIDVQAGNNLVLNTGATLRHQADLTLDAASVDIDASMLDMSGVDSEGDRDSIPGYTLTLDNGAQLEATNTALINLRGGNGFFSTTTAKPGAAGGSLVITNGDVNLESGALVDLIGGYGGSSTSGTVKAGGKGGSVVLTSGSLTTDPTAVIDLRGGLGMAPSEAASTADPSSPPDTDAALLGTNPVGNVGSFTITGGTANLQGYVHLSGRDAISLGVNNGKDGGTLDISGGDVTIAGTVELSGGAAVPDANSHAGSGGTLLVSGGTTELTGSVLLEGLDGGNGVDTGQEGGRAGDGGSVDVSGGTLALSTGALIDLSSGIGGTGTTTNGADGIPGSVSVTGGTLELNGGLITADSAATPSVDPINIIQTDVSVTGTGTVRVNDHMTIDDTTLTVDAATFDASGTDSSTPIDGNNLTVNGAASVVNLTGTALIDLDGGNDTDFFGDGANAGSFVFNDGSLTVGPSATIRSRGGTTLDDFDAPGLSGSATFNGGTADIQGTLNIKGRDGKNAVTDTDSGQLGRDGGSFTIGGTADVTITGELSIQGGKGGNSGSGGSFSSPNGGNGGDGGTLTVQAGTLTTNSAATVKLQGGNGGNGDGTSGNGGDGGQLLVQGGTVNIQGGSTFTMQGGRAGSDDSSTSSGDGGQIVVEGGTVNIHDGSTFNMTGADGSSDDAGGNAGHGGQLLISGGNTTIDVTMDMAAGNGSDGRVAGFLFDPPGDGGNGGVIDVSGGTLTLNTGAWFDLTPGLGGIDLEGGDPGIDGAPATVSVTGGGVMTINGATITGDTTFVPTNADPIQIHKTNITLGTATMSLTADAAVTSESLVLTEDTTLDNTTVNILDTGTFNLTSGITLTAQNNSAINADISLLITANAADPFDTTTVNIISGSTLATAGQLDIGTGDGGTLLIDGPDSSLTTDTGTVGVSNWGGGGGVATVTVSDQATADVGQLRLAHTGIGSATLTVESDADMTSRQLNIATGGLASATTTVTGTGSTYTQVGASPLNVGSSDVGTGTGTLNIADSAVFTTGTSGITVNDRGTINVNTNAKLNAPADVTLEGGTINIGNATLDATPNIGNGRTLTLNAGALLDATGTAEIKFQGDDFTTTTGGTIQLNDGTINLGPDASLTLAGTIQSPGPGNDGGHGGQINITGGTANLDGLVNASASNALGNGNDGGDTGTITVSGGNLNQANTGTINLTTARGEKGDPPGQPGTPGTFTVSGGNADLAGTIDLSGNNGSNGSGTNRPSDGADAGTLSVTDGSMTLSGTADLSAGNGGNGVDTQDGGDGGDGGTVLVSGGTLTLNTPASINLSPGNGGDPGPSGGSAGTNGSAGVVRIFSGATLNINGASIFVDAGDAALAEAVDPITITNVTIDVGIQDTNDGGTLNLNDDTTLDNATLNRADIGTVNLAATKTLTATNGSTIDYDNDTTIGTDQTYDISASTFRHNGNLTLDDGALILNDTTLDADGNFFNPAPQSVPGFTLTLNGTGALLDAQSTAVVDLSGGDSDSDVNHGQLGGSLIVNGGTFNLDTPATLDLDGGDGIGGGLPGGNGGSGGALTITNGTVTLNGTANIRGQDGEDTNTVGSNNGGDAGPLTVSGGSTTLAGAMNLTGGKGGDNSLFGSTGGDGGNGGLVDVSGGTLTLNTGAAIDLTPGLGGTGDSADGTDGTPGAINVAGGTLTLNAGLATANNTLTPIGDTTEFNALVINLSVGVIDASATSTTLSHASTLNITGGAATFDTLTVEGSSTLDNNGGTTTVNTAINLNHGTINGPIGGTATLTKSTPNLATLSGTDPNTYTGLTTVTDGDLHLNKSPGVNAIGSNLTITGGDAWIFSNEQIPNTATATVLDGALRLSGNDETFTNLVLNAPGQTHLGPGGNLTTDTLSGDGKIFFDTSTNANGYTVNQGAFAGETTGNGHLIKQTPGSLTFSGTTDPAGQIFFDVNEGQLHLQDADLQSPDDAITIASGATLSGTANTAVGVDVTIQDGGIFTPGNSPGIFNIGGTLTLAPTATLVIEVAPAVVPIAGSDHDLVNVTSPVTLGGTLQIVALPDDATFQTTDLGTKYHVMTYDMRTAASMFDAINGTLLATDFAIAPLFRNVLSTPTDPDDTLVLRATIPGDLNFDNKVSVADLSTFALNFGTTPGLYDEAQSKNSWELGDFNTDGAITVADLSLLALNFGFDATDPSSTPTPLSIHTLANIAGLDPTSIPEPTTTTILTLTATICLRRRPATKRHSHLLQK